MISERSRGLDILLQVVIARSNTVALDFGWALFGRAGGVLFALVVAISCLGVITGVQYTALETPSY